MFKLPGCPVCESAEPVLRAYAAKSPAVRIIVEDITRFVWPVKRYEPTDFPTYILHQPGKAVAIKAGSMDTPEEIRDWVDQKMLTTSGNRFLLPPHVSEE